jgi:hypothetical protein
VKATRIRLVEVERRERPYRLRMPFKFGVTVATHGRQAILRARIRLEDGAEATGYSAEALGAKWFDKNLDLSDADNHHQLRNSLELASEAYLAAPSATPFDLFAANYQLHVDACAALGLNPLIASYGQSLVDRAILDALCRARGVSFYQAMRSNLAGLRPDGIAAEIDGFDLGRLFANTDPAKSIEVRHTVGLSDPITATDLASDMRVDDGLPQTLEEVVETYGNRYFKLKLGGDEAADLDRLGRIASVLDRLDEPYLTTLDGNEQYPDVASIAGLYRKMGETAAIARLYASVLYVEQPINRKEALARPVTELARLVPVLIDESDGELSAFAEARGLGYSGVSSKACKGIYKSMINHARCKVWNADGKPRFFMSAEDLTCEPGISIQQDLALVNLLALAHVERNAHHFIDGFGGRSEREAKAFLRQHPDLYHLQDAQVRLRLVGGRFEIGSLEQAGFGTSLDPDFDTAELMPPSRWPSREDRNDRRV